MLVGLPHAIWVLPPAIWVLPWVYYMDAPVQCMGVPTNIVRELLWVCWALPAKACVGAPWVWRELPIHIPWVLPPEASWAMKFKVKQVYWVVLAYRHQGTQSMSTPNRPLGPQKPKFPTGTSNSFWAALHAANCALGSTTYKAAGHRRLGCLCSKQRSKWGPAGPKKPKFPAGTSNFFWAALHAANCAPGSTTYQRTKQGPAGPKKPKFPAGTSNFFWAVLHAANCAPGSTTYQRTKQGPAGPKKPKFPAGTSNIFWAALRAANCTPESTTYQAGGSRTLGCLFPKQCTKRGPAGPKKPKFPPAIGRGMGAPSPKIQVGAPMAWEAGCSHHIIGGSIQMGGSLPKGWPGDTPPEDAPTKGIAVRQQKVTSLGNRPTTNSERPGYLQSCQCPGNIACEGASLWGESMAVKTKEPQA
ncbi:hypothetical protein C8R44DRAFT_733834 [Mycena epipterygia]|nr:hypothetical protein C8R44DRAFT_733834 [Mycena epipterygia]